MTYTNCEYETSIIQAAKSGKWDLSQRAHLETCASCAQALKLHEVMQGVAVAESKDILVPDPRLVWLKAAFAARQKRDTLITRIAGVAYAGLAVAIGAGVISVLDSSPSNALNDLPKLSISSIAPFMVVLIGILVAFLLSMPSRRQSR